MTSQTVTPYRVSNRTKRPAVQEPGLDKGLRGWIVNTARVNYWRVSSWYQLDDLIQDGYLCYSKVASKYTTANQKHLMALVQRTFINHITDLARNRGRLNEVPVSDISESPETFFDGVMEPNSEATDVAMLLLDAPAEAIALLKALSSDLMSAPYRKADGTRETTNERICRISGIDLSSDILDTVHRFLTKQRGEPLMDKLVSLLTA